MKSLVRKAYSEDKLFCIRILFYFRDIRGNGGQGERNVFREGMKELIDIDPKTICKVLRFKKSHLVKFTDNRFGLMIPCKYLNKENPPLPNIKVEGLGKIITSTYLGKEAKVRVER